MHEIDRCLNKLGDPEIARVPRVEERINDVNARVNNLGGWSARATGF